MTTRMAHYQKLAMGTDDDAKLAKYEDTIADLEENIEATKEQMATIVSKRAALEEQATNASLATDLATKIAEERSSTMEILKELNGKIQTLDNTSKEKFFALEAHYELVDQLQYEAESEMDDDIKAEKMAEYEKAYDEVDQIHVDMESAE